MYDLRKNRNSTSFPPSLSFFFLFLRTVRDWHELSTCKVDFKNSDTHSHNFTNLAAQNASKQRMTKYHPQKSLSNNARSAVKSLPPFGFFSSSVVIV